MPPAPRCKTPKVRCYQNPESVTIRLDHCLSPVPNKFNVGVTNRGSNHCMKKYNTLCYAANVCFVNSRYLHTQMGQPEKNYLLHCKIVDISATNFKLKLLKSKWPKEKTGLKGIILLRLSWLVKQNHKKLKLKIDEIWKLTWIWFF